MRILAFFIVFIYCAVNCLAEETDSTYSSVLPALRFGLNGQKGYGVEAGLSANTYGAFFVKPKDTFPFYHSFSVYLISEFVLRDRNNIIYGPKIGVDLSYWGESHVNVFGIEYIRYTDFKGNSTPALSLRFLGIPMKWINANYAYTFFYNKNFEDFIGRHRFSLTYTFNPVAIIKTAELVERRKEALKRQTQDSTGL